MVARRIPTILPKPSYEESLEITRIYSVLGMVDKENPLMKERPFRSVHHTVTRAALTGGGLIPSPGEISLAHGGVLFLDELAEFKKQVLEVLRQPLEERKIRINRARGGYEFPADFMLVAAMNIATTKLIQWKTAEKPENKAFRGFFGFVFSLFEPFFCRGSSSVF